ncbi:hypothetical protein NPIL_628041 [Nephila pilipes]|uniref:Uncharacterized protein n=1 Tax=Nephila pilipes TaxID=299642 RepID=A0A8X6U4V6_NEPPI|nr:hypothetical protein NPIL_628041 [Nephila pilipes]
MLKEEEKTELSFQLCLLTCYSCSVTMSHSQWNLYIADNDESSCHIPNIPHDLKGNIKAQITKLSNWKETNDPADIAAHLTVLEKLQKKFDDLKTEYFESATNEEINEIEMSLGEMDSDIQELEVRFTAFLHNS